MAAEESKYDPNETQGGELVPEKTESDELYDSIAKMVNADEEKKQAQGQGCSIQPCIFRVPESLRKLKPGAYTPRVVCIGPLNRCDERLNGMQDHKVSYMNALFARTVNSQETMRRCGDAMLEMVPRARACYAESFDCSNVMFAKMMLLDGCFILELVSRYMAESIEWNDPIMVNILVLGDVKHDLLLLENQIPYFVLQQLFQLTLQQAQNPGGCDLSLTKYLLEFLNNMMIFESKMITDKTDTTKMDDNHILALLHNCYNPVHNENSRECPVMKYSATQLNRMGVKFKASKGEDYYLLVKFRTSCLFSWVRTLSKMLSSCLLQRCSLGSTQLPLPVCIPEEQSKISPTNCCLFYWLCQLCGTTRLEIPPLHLYDTTESFLRNLIAYEQCSPNIPHYITGYAFLMDALINSKEDVELLEWENILENSLGSSEDASDLFNNLCKEISIGGSYYYADQWKHLNDYCNRYWPRHLASLRLTYFSNPWSLLSFIAALLLFALSATQTAYSVMSYRSSSNSN